MIYSTVIEKIKRNKVINLMVLNIPEERNQGTGQLAINCKVLKATK
jgi:hypothetical protein